MQKTEAVLCTLSLLRFFIELSRNMGSACGVTILLQNRVSMDGYCAPPCNIPNRTVNADRLHLPRCLCRTQHHTTSAHLRIIEGMNMAIRPTNKDLIDLRVPQNTNRTSLRNICHMSETMSLHSGLEHTNLSDFLKRGAIIEQ